MTPKQQLLAHLAELHPHTRFPKSTTLHQLQRLHGTTHYRYSTNHVHAGENPGPDNRPEGWTTGADVTMKKQPGYGVTA